MRNILIVAAGIVAVAAIAGGVYFGTRPAGPGPIPGAAANTPNATALLAIQPSDHVMGDDKAQVVLIEYASLTCPHCAHFHTVVMPELKKKWIDTGQVKLVYRDFPLDQPATKAAQLAECMGNEKYFTVVDIIFRSQPVWAAAADPVAELVKTLRIAGMSEADAKACFANEAVLTAILNEASGGQALGVNSTPTLFIDGQQFRGARSVEELDQLFTKLVKK